MFSIRFVRLVVGFKTSPVVAPIRLHCIIKQPRNALPFWIRLHYVAWPTTLPPSRLSFSHMSIIPQTIPKHARRLNRRQEYTWIVTLTVKNVSKVLKNHLCCKDFTVKTISFRLVDALNRSGVCQLAYNEVLKAPGQLSENSIFYDGSVTRTRDHPLLAMSEKPNMSNIELASSIALMFLWLASNFPHWNWLNWWDIRRFAKSSFL